MNYKFFALLATLSIFILSCRDTKKTSQTQNPKRLFKGNVVIGHEAHSFSPCNSQKVYWINGNQKFEYLDSEYQKFRYPTAYSPVYVEMTATLDTVSERIGFAEDFDGYVLLDSIHKVEMLEPYNDCHKLLSNTTDQTFSTEQVSFNVYNFEFGNYTHTTVTPLGFRISKDYLKHTVLGHLESVQVDDLDKNGLKELYVIYDTSNEDLSAKLWILNNDANDFVNTVYIPKFKNKIGYQGHDRFTFYPNYLKREFPLYNDDDKDKRPTAGTWVIHYGLEHKEDGITLVELPGAHWQGGIDWNLNHSEIDSNTKRQCFEYYDKNNGKVVSQLELRINNNQFEGLYGWDDGETDSSYGILKHGIVDGHLYWVEYHYNTEGQDMVQEVVFKKIQQGYLQGFGELYENNGVYRIDRSKEIDFATGLFFRKTDCP